MSIVTVQPGQAVLADPNAAEGGGWAYGIPTVWDSPSGAAGIGAISGLSSSAGNVFGDSPPIDGELYLVTGFTIGYAALIPTSSAESDTQPPTVVELALMVGPDVLYRATDSQDNLVDIWGEGVDATYLSNGVFTADLVNPIAVATADLLKIRMGALTSGDGATVCIGAQLLAQGAGALEAIPYPSVISYQLIKPQAGS